MNASKPTVIVFGNCQARWLADTMRLKSAVTRSYEILYIPSNPKSPLEDRISDPAFIQNCSHVLWQTAAGCKPPSWVATIPARVCQIRYPTLCLKWLWPLHMRDPARAIEEPGFPNGRFSYGDRLLIKLLENGVPAEDLARQYMDTDISTVVNLERYYEMAVAELRYNDQQSDIAATPLILSGYQTARIFSAVNHANPILLDKIVDVLMAAILGSVPIVASHEASDISDILGHQEIPVHPQVAAYFKLTWYKPEMTWRYGAEQLTLEQYVEAYAYCRAIPYQEGPQIWLDRAENAAKRHEMAEVERLLLKGAALYTGQPAFFERLTVHYLQQKRLLDAEKVVRYAMTLFHPLSSLHWLLGTVLFYRRFPAEAVLQFKEALHLDPQNTRVANDLRVALQACRSPKPTPAAHLRST